MMKRVSNPFRVHLQPCTPRKGYLRIEPPPVVSANSMWRAAASSTTTRVAPPGLTPIESTMEDEKRNLLEVYSILKSEILHDPAFHFTHRSRQWLQRMLDYNVPGGKLSRALSVVRCYQQLQDGKETCEREKFRAYVLAWCIEWFNACLLVIDDIIDRSYTRRGKPCWFRLSQVGMIATNDAILLQTHIFRILKNHFSDKPCYVDLLDLFHEVGFQSVCGKMFNVITPLQDQDDLSNYTMELYLSIAKYKSGYYSLYLPVACASTLAGERFNDQFDVKDILLEMASYYQMEDDYLDCFGDPEVTGKVGTDIEDGKCSWLIIQALEHANPQLKKILYGNYGKNDPACVAKVKQIYACLELQNIYKQYQKKKFQGLNKSVENHPSKAVQVIWREFLGRLTTSSSCN